jgi:mannose-1-phosphate guanylyltransferase/mannose-6-phosphate isomerase
LVTTVGISELVIIDTDDALLVASKKNLASIEKIYQKLSNLNRNELINHRKVFRPWGYYDLLDKGENFQVKRILVNSNSKLSLQKHNHRSEHWVIVKGIATVTREDEVFELSENQSTYIPIGIIHCLENKYSSPLEIIEIQTGSYLGEDDIIRIEDKYKRN